MKDQSIRDLAYKKARSLVRSRLVLALFLMNFTYFLTNPQGQAASYLREECRGRMAGIYLSLLDAKNRDQEKLSKIETKQKKLKIEIERLHPQVIQDIRGADDFDLDSLKSGMVDQSRYKLNRVQEAFHDAQLQGRKLRAKLAEAEVKLTGLKTKMTAIFKFVPVQQKVKGYGFRIDYIQACPAYRFNCPLSRRYSLLLEAVLPKEEMPEACLRYASFRN